jgi:ABC-type antimicrobial peptide transport system permease subunit
MRALVPGMPVQDMRTVRDEIDAMFPEERLIAMVLRTIAGLAVTLGLFGVAAVMAFTLSERTRELGIRAALGASAGRVVRDALRPAIGAAALGAGLGVGLYGAASRVLASRLHGVHALDPLTIAGTTAALMAAAMVAAWIPARRAGRLDPTIALRTE